MGGKNVDSRCGQKHVKISIDDDVGNGQSDHGKNSKGPFRGTRWSTLWQKKNQKSAWSGGPLTQLFPSEANQIPET